MTGRVRVETSETDPVLRDALVDELTKALPDSDITIVDPPDNSPHSLTIALPGASPAARRRILEGLRRIIPDTVLKPED